MRLYNEDDIEHARAFNSWLADLSGEVNREGSEDAYA